MNAQPQQQQLPFDSPRETKRLARVELSNERASHGR